MAQDKAKIMERQRVRLNSSLAAAAPAVIPLVIIISTDALTMLRISALDSLGLLAAAVVILVMSFLLWRRRWWAGLPALAIFALLAVVFGWKALRPLWAYYQANSFNGQGGGFMPLVMVSPALVIATFALLLGRLVFKGVRVSMAEGGDPVSLKTWGVLFIWLTLLAGDAAYQEHGWRYLKNPSDLVLRLCLGDENLRMEARKYLMQLGPDALPALLQGAAAPGPGLACLRERSREVLEDMGPMVKEALVESVLSGGETALLVLQDIGDAQTALPLIAHYRDPQRRSSEDYDRLLKTTIARLDPAAALD